MSVPSLETAILGGDRLLIDTTVLAAYLDATDSTHPVAVHVLDEFVATGRNPGVISMITVMEILVRPFRTHPSGHHTVLAFLKAHPNLECVPVDLQVAQDAAFLRADKRFSPPDALIVATGLATQVRYLVTNDRNWSKKLASMAARIAVVQTSAFPALPVR